jgi:two-component system cell cycle response regulator
MSISVGSGQLGLRQLARAWYVVATVGVAVFTAHTLAGTGLGWDDFFNRWLYNGLILLGLAACVVRTLRVRTERGAWLAFTVAVAAWAAGEIFYDFVYSGDPPYPSVADVFYLAFYPACYVGLLLLLRARLSEFTHRLWLDGAMAALGSAALGAAVLFEVVLESTEGSTGVIITNLAYPLGDILLLSAVVGIFALTGWRADRTWLLIAGGLVATAFADAVFLYQAATETYLEGTVLDALWPASLLLLCAAAWQRPQRVAIALAGRPLVGTPLVCGLIGLGILVVDHFHPLNLLALSLASGTILMVMLRTALTFRENSRVLQLMRGHAVTDALTGLGNRRRLLADLERVLADGSEAEPRLLVIFDLDGFKRYNDTFGHPAGDVLLARLAGNLAGVVGSMGSSYRLGGDEFCVLAGVSEEQTGAFLDATSAALTDEGEGFTVGSSFGAVFLPDEALTASESLRLADQRLYAQKRDRATRGNPHELLLQALYEREPDLRVHVQSVAEMACAVGRVLGLSAPKLEELRLAARLHDVGKLAIPDAVLRKPGPLDVNEWAFIKEHTVIGERILSAAPVLSEVGHVVRATHERWDGGGYPDGLAGTEIPLPARIIAVCDAFSAMTTTRPYRIPVDRDTALAELCRCAGTQFDPQVVAIFCGEAEIAARDGWGGLRAAGAA